MALIYCEGDSELAKGYAKNAAEILALAYPNHSWWVECKQGVLIIKHFGISGTIGMVRHCSTLDYSAADFKCEIYTAAGELLERAGLPRGAYDGQPVLGFEADPEIEEHFADHRPLTMKVIH